MKNELIREFEKQSFITTETQKISGAWDNIVEPFRYVTVTETNFSLEKFAELIVRECARIARATPCPYEEDEVRQRLGHTWDMASLEAGHEIVKHFGVEE
jgi:hypothetical protein